MKNTTNNENNQNIDFTICPTINENQKEDIIHHSKQLIKLKRLSPLELYKINRRQFNKNYILTFCPHCGHSHPLSRYTYRKIEHQLKSKWSYQMHNQLTPTQRKLRAKKAGQTRALNAGQKLRSKGNVQEGILI